MIAMDIPSKYDPSKTEDKWYQHWLDKGIFRSVPDDREPYTIVIPPPNVTGVLHMGHMLNNTIQDILMRRARMKGKNTLWVPGTDHASIATEARVVAHLKKKGISKSGMTREEFLDHAWEWRRKHGGIILEQLKKLGASCDWDRTKFTMDDDLSESVIQVFIDLYRKGYIYRGVRMVNWDPSAKTAVSDEEVIYPYISASSVLVAMSQQAYDKYHVENLEDALVVIDEDLVKPVLDKHRVLAIPARRIAEGLGGVMVANIVMLGFLTAVTDIASADSMKKSLLAAVPKGTEELNMEAFEKGYVYGLEQTGSAKDTKA